MNQHASIVETLAQLASELNEHTHRAGEAATAVLQINVSALIPLPLKPGSSHTPESLMSLVRDYLIGELASRRLSTTIDDISLSEIRLSASPPLTLAAGPYLRLVSSKD